MLQKSSAKTFTLKILPDTKVQQMGLSSGHAQHTVS